MDNVARITHTALCVYREDRANEFNRRLAVMNNQVRAGEGATDRYYVNLDKMLKAGYECHDVHAILNTGAINPCDVLDREFLDKLRDTVGDKAEKAYARAEQRMEDKSLAKFHKEAFGE